MGELEDRLEAVLNDPRQMERIARMASTLMGGMGMGAGTGDGSGTGGDGEGGRENENKRRLLSALSPFLSAGRQQRLERALRVAAAARLARAAMSEWGGGSG
ncbi:MAG: hypothetical protein SPE74_00305 [Oscillospiraceae bacterium]|nr:hypothetical protein [Oscillospiraceae bacterium]